MDCDWSVLCNRNSSILRYERKKKNVDRCNASCTSGRHRRGSASAPGRRNCSSRRSCSRCSRSSGRCTGRASRRSCTCTCPRRLDTRGSSGSCTCARRRHVKRSVLSLHQFPRYVASCSVRKSDAPNCSTSRDRSSIWASRFSESNISSRGFMFLERKKRNRKKERGREQKGKPNRRVVDRVFPNCRFCRFDPAKRNWPVLILRFQLDF